MFKLREKRRNLTCAKYHEMHMANKESALCNGSVDVFLYKWICNKSWLSWTLSLAEHSGPWNALLIRIVKLHRQKEVE